MQYRIVLLFLFVQFWRYQNIGQMKEGNGFSESFIVGVIAVVFLVIGYQTALFIHRAAVMKIAAGRDEPDTVYLYRKSDSESNHEGSAGEYSADMVAERRSGSHSPRAEAVRENLPREHRRRNSSRTVLRKEPQSSQIHPHDRNILSGHKL